MSAPPVTNSFNSTYMTQLSEIDRAAQMESMAS